MLSRLPIRLRLTLAFAVAMAAVLALTGAFVYFRLERALTRSVDQGLRARAADVRSLVGRPDRDEGLVQVLTARGSVLRASPGLAGRPLLSTAEIARALVGTALVERKAPLQLGGERWRLLARPIQSPRGPAVAVLAASLEPREEALGHLLFELLVGGAAALALASLGGYALASFALRPVEAMSRKAAEISLTGEDRRLPVPAANDEIAHLGERLNEMLARIDHAVARERRFLADASHELRTPLAILKTELELALRRHRPPRELERVVSSAAEETERLARLAEELLLVARADQGVLPVRRSPSDARKLLADVAERFAQRAAVADRRIRRDAPAGLEVLCDPGRVEQALSNLVDNALRHGDGTIVLAARERNGSVEFHVSDDGRGFPPEFLPRAFERFSRADEARTGGGSGLGLAIVEAIAHAHGGEAGAANGSEGGSDVWLALPRGRPA